MRRPRRRSSRLPVYGPRKPGQALTRAAAITSFCRLCRYESTGIGGEKLDELIEQCDEEDCHLWPYRTGRKDPSAFE